MNKSGESTIVRLIGATVMSVGIYFAAIDPGQFRIVSVILVAIGMIIVAFGGG